MEIKGTLFKVFPAPALLKLAICLIVGLHVSQFLITVAKVPKESNSEEERLIWAHDQRFQSTASGLQCPGSGRRQSIMVDGVEEESYQLMTAGSRERRGWGQDVSLRGMSPVSHFTD